MSGAVSCAAGIACALRAACLSLFGGILTELRDRVGAVQHSVFEVADEIYVVLGADVVGDRIARVCQLVSCVAELFQPVVVGIPARNYHTSDAPVFVHVLEIEGDTELIVGGLAVYVAADAVEDLEFVKQLVIKIAHGGSFLLGMVYL